jgi:16S rRNA (cytosine1402-N4)-methyltransferase
VKKEVMTHHVPVLLSHVLSAVAARRTPPRSLLDCTFGFGGHTSALLERFPSITRALALDRDEAAASRAAALQSTYGRDRLEFVNCAFSSAPRVIRSGERFDVVLLDLGFASSHVDDASRGFSFQLDGPLDMRYSQQTQNVTAAQLVNERPQSELAFVFQRYGDEKLAAQLATAIVERRQAEPFLMCKDLSNVCFRVALRHAHGARSHRVEGAWQTCRRVFQALRIAVNDELGELASVLEASPSLLADEGTLLVISFHSLEHDAVKRFLDAQCGKSAERERARLTARLDARNPNVDHSDVVDAMVRDGKVSLPVPGQALFTRPKSKLPTSEEVKQNSRAASAKLRIATRLARSEL